MGVRSYAGVSGYGTGEGFVVYTSISSYPPNTTKKPPLIYCHGGASTAYKSADVVLEALLLKELAEDYVVISGDWGGDLFGNAASITLMENALTFIRTYWNASTADPTILGISMGAATALGYARTHAVAKVAAVIPLTDLYGGWRVNKAGQTAAINTAFGGTYDPATMNATADPITYASTISSSKPICLFYSTTDTLLPNETAFRFARARTSTKIKSIGALGHTAEVLGLAKDTIKSYLSNPAAFVGDTVPTAPTLTEVVVDLTGTSITLPSNYVDYLGCRVELIAGSSGAIGGNASTPGGGVGGAAAVWDTDFTPAPGQTIAYQRGAAGVGGIYSTGVPTAGTDSWWNSATILKAAASAVSTRPGAGAPGSSANSIGANKASGSAGTAGGTTGTGHGGTGGASASTPNQTGGAGGTPGRGTINGQNGSPNGGGQGGTPGGGPGGGRALTNGAGADGRPGKARLAYTTAT